MSGRWQRTFEVSAPVERVWRAFTDPEERAKLVTPTKSAPPDPNASLAPEVLEVQPLKLLRWAQHGGSLPERAEFTVVLESKDGGSRFTVTRIGFGESEDADVFSEANALGWECGFMDLVLYLETAQIVQRHYFGSIESVTGMAYRERDWGLEVLRVGPGTFAAEVGLARGDRLVRIGAAPVYERSDLLVLLAEHSPGTLLEVEFIRGRERRRGAGRLSRFEARAVGE
jgi:uncharacterized protein YndB with AHSA1/START domain